MEDRSNRSIEELNFVNRFVGVPEYPTSFEDILRYVDELSVGKSAEEVVAIQRQQLEAMVGTLVKMRDNWPTGS